MKTARAETINCDNYVDIPLEQAFKAFYILQSYDEEFKEELNSLKEKLMKMFENIPIKNNEKRIDYFLYKPTGLCSWQSTLTSDSYSRMSILLDPWDFPKQEIANVKRNITYNFKHFKDDNRSFYTCCKVFFKKSFPVRSEYVKRSIKECVQAYEISLKLDEENKKLVNIKGLILSIESDLIYQLREFFEEDRPYYSRRYSRNNIIFYTKESIEKFLEIYKGISPKGDKILSTSAKSFVDDYIEKLEQKDIIFSISFKDFYYDDEISFEKFYNVCYLPLKELAETNEFLKDALTRLHFI